MDSSVLIYAPTQDSSPAVRGEVRQQPAVGLCPVSSHYIACRRRISQILILGHGVKHESNKCMYNKS